jgi:hypothetical protein
MLDVRFVLSLMVTMLSQYFNRDEEIESYLKRYNDEFPDSDKLKVRFCRVTSFMRDCLFPATSRVWKKADFFTAFVEIDYLLAIKGIVLDPAAVRGVLETLYTQVDRVAGGATDVSGDAARYARAALQATNDRSNRVLRGTVVRTMPLDRAADAIAAK